MKVERSVISRIDVDTSERSSGVFVYARSAALGLELAKGKGWYGGNGHAHDESIITFDVNGEKYHFPTSSRITVVESREDYEKYQILKKKRAAMSKLTQEERILLGLEQLY